MNRVPRPKRHVFLAFDTAVVAVTNAGVLLLAARALSPTELSDFSLLLLVLTTTVALQRASFLAPGFAAQRVSGRAGIPIRWLLKLSVPLAALSATLIVYTIGDFRVSVNGALLVAAVALSTIANDILRSHLIGAGALKSALLADVGILLLAAVCFLRVSSSPTVVGFVASYAIATWGGFAVLLGTVIFSKTYLLFPPMTLRATWRLGKWSGLDNLMSATANLLPMFVATLVLGYDFAGTYRVLQAALGPLNILSTTIVTSFGLDSWRLISIRDLEDLGSRVRKICIRLVAFAAAYLLIGELAVIWLSDLRGEDVVRIAIVVGIAGLLTSACIPFQAGALALGYQKSGAIIRVFVLFFAIAVTLGAVGSDLLPWGDPIGAVTIFAATVNLLGWTYSYARGQKRERRLLA